jgi:hypothetical protein
VPAVVRVRLAIAAVDQAQSLVLDLPDGLRTSAPEFEPEPLVRVERCGVEVIIGDQALCRVPRDAAQDHEKHRRASK